MAYGREWKVRCYLEAERWSCDDAESWHVLNASAGTLVNGSWPSDMVELLAAKPSMYICDRSMPVSARNPNKSIVTCCRAPRLQGSAALAIDWQLHLP